MVKATRAAAAAPEAEVEVEAEPRTVRLFRLQDRYTSPLMSETEAAETLAGYPGEYERVAEVEQAPAPTEEAATDGD